MTSVGFFLAYLLSEDEIFKNLLAHPANSLFYIICKPLYESTDKLRGIKIHIVHQ